MMSKTMYQGKQDSVIVEDRGLFQIQGPLLQQDQPIFKVIQYLFIPYLNCETKSVVFFECQITCNGCKSRTNT